MVGVYESSNFPPKNLATNDVFPTLADLEKIYQNLVGWKSNKLVVYKG